MGRLESPAIARIGCSIILPNESYFVMITATLQQTWRPSACRPTRHAEAKGVASVERPALEVSLANLLLFEVKGKNIIMIMIVTRDFIQTKV